MVKHVSGDSRWDVVIALEVFKRHDYGNSAWSRCEDLFVTLTNPLQKHDTMALANLLQAVYEQGIEDGVKRA